MIERGRKKMKKLITLSALSLLFFVGCSNKTNENHVLSTTTSSSQSENRSLKNEHTTQLSSSETTQTSLTSSTEANATQTNEQFPKITKQFLNGTTWYEGNTAGIENQPRQGFKNDQFQDLIGNSVDYEIITEPSKTYTVLDYRKNVTVQVDLATKIKVNKPRLDGTYQEVTYFLYYKYDGTLMIVTTNGPVGDHPFTSYPLERINN